MRDYEFVKRVNASPAYQKLVKTRSSYGWFLTALMMIVYYGFILMVAFGKGFMSQRIGEGVMTYALPIGLFVLVFTIVITGIYVRRANTEFDELNEALRKEVKQ